jgi:HNH endonuclease/AP2 domain
MRELFDPTHLAVFFQFDAEAGKLWWKKRDPQWFLNERSSKIWNTKYAGKEAFTSISSVGYKHGQLLGRHITAHRALWCLHHGRDTLKHIDHINGERTDNRLCNLREATNAQNGMNQKLSTKNTSGYKGVSWSSEKRKWLAQVIADGKHYNLGYYAQIEDAALAYAKGAKLHQGEFHRLR